MTAARHVKIQKIIKKTSASVTDHKDGVSYVL